MHIILYKVNNIDDYFFYLINPSKKEVNILNSKYPKGVEEIKTINLNYEYNDIFLDKFLNSELLKIVANNIFFRFDSIDKFIDIINEFHKNILNIDEFLINGMKKINSDKYISDIFVKNLKLKNDVVKNINSYYKKDINYFQFKKDDLEDSILLRVLDNFDDYNLFVNFNDQSFLQKI